MQHNLMTAYSSFRKMTAMLCRFYSPQFTPTNVTGVLSFAELLSLATIYVGIILPWLLLTCFPAEVGANAQKNCSQSREKILQLVITSVF